MSKIKLGDVAKGIFFEENNDTDKFISDIKNIIKKYFPKSLFDVSLYKGLGTSVSIRFSVGQKSDWANGIFQNDICPVTDLIFGFTKDGKMESKLDYDAGSMKSILVKPKEGSYMAYDRVKTNARSKKGNSIQVLKQIDTNFKNLLKTLKDNENDFSKSHEYAKKYI